MCVGIFLKLLCSPTTTNNFHQANEKKSNTPEERWTRPDLRFIKLNVDAAYYIDEGVGATAAVIRDEKGIFLAAKCIFIPHEASVVSTEARAMKDGLAFANSLGFPRVEAESDSSTVIESCAGQTTWWDEAAATFAQCVDLSTLIGKVNFKHCSRSCSQAAHVLAKFSYCIISFFSSWTDEPRFRICE